MIHPLNCNSLVLFRTKVGKSFGNERTLNYHFTYCQTITVFQVLSIFKNYSKHQKHYNAIQRKCEEQLKELNKIKRYLHFVLQEPSVSNC